jgi:hypothetical protein
MRSASGLPVCAVLWMLARTCAAADVEHALYVDEDLLSGFSQDADYTGGVAVTFSGERAEDERYEIEVGGAAFTPQDISDPEIVAHDRPYAGLIYVSGALDRLSENRGATTSLAVGVLGLPLIASAQRTVHRAMHSARPRGWRHQISNGGEPTLRLAHERRWLSEPVEVAGQRVQWLYRAGAGVGFLTDLSLGIAARAGRFADLRWDIHTSPTGLSDRAAFGRTAERDRFFYATLTARVPVYDALVQGQFRDSDVTVSAHERRYLVPAASVGFVLGLPKGRNLHYFIRAQRSDVRLEERSETAIYGGISLSW